MTITGRKSTRVAAWLVAAGLVSCAAREGPAAGPLDTVVDSGWIPVPALVVPAIPLPEGSWKRNAGWSCRELDIRHEVGSGGELLVTISDSDGYSGAPLKLRLSAGAKGRVSVLATASSYSCVSNRECIDLAGEVRIEERPRGGARPLRLAFVLDGLDKDSRKPWFDPSRMEGALEIPLVAGEWDIELRSPSDVELAPASSAVLHSVIWRWSDGTTRAQGFVDTHGRRHGTWETWYENGTRQSAIEFDAGERRGLWRIFGLDGELQEEGRIEGGMRQGDWTEYHRGDNWLEVEQVSYVDGEARN